MTMSGTAGQGPLMIVCGGGLLPFAVADAAKRRGRKVFIYALRDSADAERVASYPHIWGGVAQFGRFCRYARQHDCQDVVFIGSLTRPVFWRMRPDLKTLLLAPKIYQAFLGGDDHLLSGIGRLLEQHGFRIVGAHEIAPEILLGEGLMGSEAPSERDQADIVRGLELLQATGPFDIGQAAVIAHKRVLAIEASEGTDRMLERLAQLRREEAIRWPAGTGVLVKAPKPGQNNLFDLPSIGPKTIEMAALAGLAGVAVAAGATMVAEPQAVIAAADRARLFVTGVPAWEPKG
jgi:DUF1009 family protein